jgi:hypothetical protein
MHNMGLLNDGIEDVGSCLEKRLRENPGERLFVEHPTVYRIKLHLRWLTRSGNGLLESNTTNTILHNRLSSLKQAIKLSTSYRYSEANNAALSNYIRQV